ncbi:hypothetical protein AQI95_05005 [Streptomyces yokosukanensis]|uniref:Uncharacterized protein n=1 Tax=Streptomyces yokosukanensis TaxID=67386 RepID=A0A117Q5C6_9ACTN|nr:hypothetical protein [Streptomyces yokosukanensis]KUN09208.1 hypothetical protein AQI95_05005 [Streptomyces yokosukanensis]
MDRTRAGRRDIARLLAVCAVLIGVFLMHGAPATAAEGCHDATPAMAAAPAAHGHHAAPIPAAASPVHASGPAVGAAAATGTAGTLCVSTPAHERFPLPAPGLLAVAGAGALALWVSARLRAAADGTGRRGPPARGRDLLLQVCVART